MKFTLPINHPKEKASYEEYYDFLNSNKTKRSYIMLTVGIIFLIATMFIHSPSFREKLFVLGAMITVGYAFILFYYTNHKKKFLKEVDRQYQLFTDNNVKEYTCEFSENYWLLEHELNSSKIAWSLFHSYSLINDKLVLHMNKGDGLFYLLCKDEFSAEDFEQIVSFVNERVKKRK